MIRIFATVGSQKFPFDRLVKAVDELGQDPNYSVFIQNGVSEYEPKFSEFQKFLTRDEFIQHSKEADVILTHAGTGAIITALKSGKKVICMPRLAKYGEHVDDHQTQLSSVFEEKGYLLQCTDPAELGSVLEKLLATKFKPFESNTDNFMEHLKGIIDGFLGEKK